MKLFQLSLVAVLAITVSALQTSVVTVQTQSPVARKPDQSRIQKIWNAKAVKPMVYSTLGVVGAVGVYKAIERIVENHQIIDEAVHLYQQAQKQQGKVMTYKQKKTLKENLEKLEKEDPFKF